MSNTLSPGAARLRENTLEYTYHLMSQFNNITSNEHYDASDELSLIYIDNNPVAVQYWDNVSMRIMCNKKGVIQSNSQPSKGYMYCYVGTISECLAMLKGLYPDALKDSISI